jgi:hypothetical protein
MQVGGKSDNNSSYLLKKIRDLREKLLNPVYSV